MGDLMQEIKDREEREKFQEIARIQDQIRKEAETDPLLAAALKEPFGLTRITVIRQKDQESKQRQALDFVLQLERVKHLPRSERSTDPNHPNFDPSMVLKIEPWMEDLINPKKPPLWKVWGLKAAKGALVILQVVGIISLAILVTFLVGVGLGGLMAIVDILVGSGT